MKSFMAPIFLVVLGIAGQPALAEEPPLCLDCHEPASDWQDMSTEEIYEAAKDADIKRHKDNLELSDDELRSMIELLMT